MNSTLAAFTFREFPFVQREHGRLLMDVKTARSDATDLEKHCRGLGKGHEDKKKYGTTVTVPANRKVLKRINAAWAAFEDAIEVFGEMMRDNQPANQAEYEQLIKQKFYKALRAKVEGTMKAFNRLLVSKQRVVDVAGFEALWKRVSKKAK